MSRLFKANFEHDNGDTVETAELLVKADTVQHALIMFDEFSMINGIEMKNYEEIEVH